MKRHLYQTLRLQTEKHSGYVFAVETSGQRLDEVLANRLSWSETWRSEGRICALAEGKTVWYPQSSRPGASAQPRIDRILRRRLMARTLDTNIPSQSYTVNTG